MLWLNCRSAWAKNKDFPTDCDDATTVKPRRFHRFHDADPCRSSSNRSWLVRDRYHNDTADWCFLVAASANETRVIRRYQRNGRGDGEFRILARNASVRLTVREHGLRSLFTTVGCVGKRVRSNGNKWICESFPVKLVNQFKMATPLDVTAYSESFGNRKWVQTS